MQRLETPEASWVATEVATRAAADLATTLLVMTDPGTWIATVFTAATLGLGYLTYRAQRAKTRLEYILTTNTTLLPRELSRDLQVTHNETVIDDPSLLILPIVNTGDRAIPADDFETDLANPWGVDLLRGGFQDTPEHVALQEGEEEAQAVPGPGRLELAKRIGPWRRFT